jgi:hypothetical protein
VFVVLEEIQYVVIELAGGLKYKQKKIMDNQRIKYIYKKRMCTRIPTLFIIVTNKTNLLILVARKLHLSTDVTGN